MRRYGVPFEVLPDNGKQFTGRHMRPQPVEVLFERVCGLHPGEHFSGGGAADGQGGAK
jgi:hypothetical protein